MLDISFFSRPLMIRLGDCYLNVSFPRSTFTLFYFIVSFFCFYSHILVIMFKFLNVSTKWKINILSCTLSSCWFLVHITCTYGNESYCSYIESSFVNSSLCILIVSFMWFQNYKCFRFRVKVSRTWLITTTGHVMAWITTVSSSPWKLHSIPSSPLSGCRRTGTIP